VPLLLALKSIYQVANVQAQHFKYINGHPYTCLK